MIVKVYSTQMGEREVETSAQTWGELKNDLRDQNISYDKMKSVIGESKLTLEADAATLPVAGFTLFLMPKKTKAGADDINTMSYKEIRAAIKRIVNKTPDTKNHFNEGKNYTTKGTEVLRDLLASFSGVTLEPRVEAKTKKKAKKSKVKKSKVKSKSKEVKAKKMKALFGEIAVYDEPRVQAVEQEEVVEENLVPYELRKVQECVKVIEKEVADLLLLGNENFEANTEAGLELLCLNLDAITDGLKDYQDNFTFYLQKKLDAIAEQERIEAENIRLAEEERLAEQARQEAEQAKKAEIDSKFDDMRDLFPDIA